MAETKLNRRFAALLHISRLAVIAAVVIAFAAGLASWLIASCSYETIRHALLSSGGFRPSTITSRFTVEMFASIRIRLRLVGSLLLLLSTPAFASIDWLSLRLARAAWAIILGWRHQRRRPLQWHAANVSIVLFCLAVAAGIRCLYLTRLVRCDEAGTVITFASRPFYVAAISYQAPNNHIFHSLLVHLAGVVFGWSEWAIRLPALCAGLLLVPLTYVLAKELVSVRAGYFAAALSATSSILVEYSTNARGYTLVAMFAVILTICAAKIRSRVSPWWCFVLAVTLVLGFWTIPIMLFAVGGPLGWLVLCGRNPGGRASAARLDKLKLIPRLAAWTGVSGTRRYRRLLFTRLVPALLGAGCVTALLYAPVVMVNGAGALVTNPYVKSRAWSAFVAGNVEVWGLALKGQWLRDLPTAMVWALIFLAIGGILFNRDLRWLVAASVLWMIALLLAFRFVPFPRTWLFYLPFFHIAVASGAALLLDRLLAPVSDSTKARISAAVAVIAVIAGALAVNRATILNSTETGVLFGAKEEVAYLAAHNVLEENVYRDPVSNGPFQYYWLRRFGKIETAPAAGDIRASRPPEAWFIVNPTEGYALASLLKEVDIRDYTVLETDDFAGSQLYHVSWRP